MQILGRLFVFSVIKLLLIEVELVLAMETVFLRITTSGFSLTYCNSWKKSGAHFCKNRKQKKRIRQRLRVSPQKKKHSRKGMETSVVTHSKKKSNLKLLFKNLI